MSSAEITKEYQKVYFLEKKDIKMLFDKIVSVMQTTAKKELTLKYSDQSSLITSNLKEVLNDENMRSREIVGLTIKINDKDKMISLLFGGKNSTAILTIKGPNRQSIYAAKSSIEDILTGLSKKRPRCGIFVFIGTIISFIITTIIYIYSVQLYPFISFYAKDENFNDIINSRGEHELSLWTLVWVFIYIISAVLVIKLISYLFPNITFLIGKEVARNDRRAKLLSNMIWVVIVTAILSIVISKIF